MASLVAAPATAPELAAALQKKYDGVKDFSADFVHAYEGGVLRKQITERGTLQVKKPGKMRWEYMAPEEKLFVSDGVKMYSYIKQDKQVIVSELAPDAQHLYSVSLITVDEKVVFHGDMVSLAP